MLNTCISTYMYSIYISIDFYAGFGHYKNLNFVTTFYTGKDFWTLTILYFPTDY